MTNFIIGILVFYSGCIFASSKADHLQNFSGRWKSISKVCQPEKNLTIKKSKIQFGSEILDLTTDDENKGVFKVSKIKSCKTFCGANYLTIKEDNAALLKEYSRIIMISYGDSMALGNACYFGIKK